MKTTSTTTTATIKEQLQPSADCKKLLRSVKTASSVKADFTKVTKEFKLSGITEKTQYTGKLEKNKDKIDAIIADANKALNTLKEKRRANLARNAELRSEMRQNSADNRAISGTAKDIRQAVKTGKADNVQKIENELLALDWSKIIHKEWISKEAVKKSNALEKVKTKFDEIGAKEQSQVIADKIQKFAEKIKMLNKEQETPKKSTKKDAKK